MVQVKGLEFDSANIVSIPSLLQPHNKAILSCGKFMNYSLHFAPFCNIKGQKRDKKTDEMTMLLSHHLLIRQDILYIIFHTI